MRNFKSVLCHEQLIFKITTTIPTGKRKYSVERGGRGGEGMEWDVGVSRRKLLCMEWISSKVLLYYIDNCIQIL